MKHLLFLLLLATPLSVVLATPPPVSYDAMVVVSIDDFNDASLEALRTQVGKDKFAYLEYSCTWSGVVVVKFSDIAMGERADVITMMRRLLVAAGIEQGVEVLHVHVASRGTGKC